MKGFVTDMQRDKLELSVEEILYLAFFIMLSITKGFGFYEGQKMFTLLVIPAFLCAVLKLVLTPYTRMQWALLIVLLPLSALVYYESEEIGILFVTFTILGMKKVSPKKVFHLGLRVWTVCMVLLSIWSFFRIEHTIYRVSNKLGLGYILRWSLGFTHPNILHITYFALCGYLLYKLADGYGFRHFLILMFGNILVFFYSVSYTGFGIVTLLLMGGLYIKYRPNFCLVEKMAVNLVLPLIVFVSFVLPLGLFGSGYSRIAQKLNFLVNTRIYIASLFLVPECTSLFGVKMSYLSQIRPYTAIDSSYIWAFVHYGIIFFVLLIFGYLILIWDYSRKQKTRELMLIVCFLGAGITEQLLFNTSFKNVTLLFLGEILFRQKEGAEEYYLIPSLYQKAESLFSLLAAKIPNGLLLLADLPSWFKTVWESKRKQILTEALAGALIGIMVCGICYHAPKGYVVPRGYTDWVDKSSVYLESSEDPAYEGYRIMNYQNADTPMQILEGDAVILETARYYAGSMLIGGLAGYMIGMGTVILKDKTKLGNLV